MSLATGPTHANRQHLEKGAASDIGAGGPKRVVIADDCYLLAAGRRAVSPVTRAAAPLNAP